MINVKKPFFPYLLQETNICSGYFFFCGGGGGSSNKYPQHMFLGLINIVFFNISNYLSNLEVRNPSIHITNFVVISNVGIKRFNCMNKMNLK